MSYSAKFLLIEDSEPDVLLIKRAFEVAGLEHDIHVVRDGEEAMEFLYQRGKHASAPRPDIILLDLGLPGMSGKDVLETIKMDQSLRDIPVCVLSTSTLPEDVADAYQLHANCYIAKPVTFEELMKVVKAIESLWFQDVLRTYNRVVKSCIHSLRAG
jgi:CheY-like chemotaxis protein